MSAKQVGVTAQQTARQRLFVAALALSLLVRFNFVIN